VHDHGDDRSLTDGREVPDTWNVIYHFEKQGRTVTYDNSLNSGAKQLPEFRGKDAMLRFDDYPAGARGFEIIPERQSDRKPPQTAFDADKTSRQPSHMQDFINCVRSREKPKCNEDEGSSRQPRS